jgi:hypothetical protein
MFAPQFKPHPWYKRFYWRFLEPKFLKRRRFAKWILPVIKNMSDCSLMADLVNVQPMQEKCGQVFYMDYVHIKELTRWQKFKKWFKI